MARHIIKPQQLDHDLPSRNDNAIELEAIKIFSDSHAAINSMNSNRVYSKPRFPEQSYLISVPGHSSEKPDALAKSEAALYFIGPGACLVLQKTAKEII